MGLRRWARKEAGDRVLTARATLNESNGFRRASYRAKPRTEQVDLRARAREEEHKTRESARETCRSVGPCGIFFKEVLVRCSLVGRPGHGRERERDLPDGYVARSTAEMVGDRTGS